MSKAYRLSNLVITFIAIMLSLGRCSDPRGISWHSSFEKEFAKLPHQGKVVPVHGNIGIDQSGGHIQGIQMYEEGSKQVVFLSGSSNEVAFIIQAEINGDVRMVSADTLMLEPYRHAGGFQIHGQYLAIGIEDNKLRNTSRVMVYDLEKEDVWSDPVQMIYRDGAFERATAGAVGMTLINDHYLIAVADWDSRHLDFYIYPESHFADGELEFRLVASLNMQSSSRESWVDSTWRSYQNINLFAESGDHFYLVGFAITGNGENVADVYRVDSVKDLFRHPEKKLHLNEPFFLTKVDFRKFETNGHSSFKWGAGLFRGKDGGLTLLACPEHIGQSTNVELFSK